MIDMEESKEVSAEEDDELVYVAICHLESGLRFSLPCQYGVVLQVSAKWTVVSTTRCQVLNEQHCCR